MGRVNAWAEIHNPIQWHGARKKTGGERFICKLPPELKAAHYLLKRVLEALFEADANTFGIKGQSRDDLAREVKELQIRGFNDIAVTDIVDCYQSVDPDAVFELKSVIQKEVIRKTLDLRNQTLVEDTGTQPQNRSHNASLHYDITDKARGPRGLMQGSPLTGLILAWLLNGIPSRDDARAYLCFDNLIVLARSPSASRAMVDTLAAHFEQCSAGPLALCDATFADEFPVEFLGYVFDPERRDIGISLDGRNEFFKKLNDTEGELANFYRAVSERHRAHGSSALFEAHNPLANHFPVEVWKLLRLFRAGFPAAADDAPELLWLLENSRWMAEWANNGMTALLHDHLFDGSAAEIGQLIKGILANSDARCEPEGSRVTAV